VYRCVNHRKDPYDRPPPLNPESGFLGYGAASDAESQPLPSAPSVEEDAAASAASAPDAYLLPVMEATVLPDSSDDSTPFTLVPAENVFPIPAPVQPTMFGKAT
jgi:hypothetical protein